MKGELKNCTYCNNFRKMSKNHIIPVWFINELKERNDLGHPDGSYVYLGVDGFEERKHHKDLFDFLVCEECNQKFSIYESKFKQSYYEFKENAACREGDIVWEDIKNPLPKNIFMFYCVTAWKIVNNCIHKQKTASESELELLNNLKKVIDNNYSTCKSNIYIYKTNLFLPTGEICLGKSSINGYKCKKVISDYLENVYKVRLHLLRTKYGNELCRVYTMFENCFASIPSLGETIEFYSFSFGPWACLLQVKGNLSWMDCPKFTGNTIFANDVKYSWASIYSTLKLKNVAFHAALKDLIGENQNPDENIIDRYYAVWRRVLV